MTRPTATFSQSFSTPADKLALPQIRFHLEIFAARMLHRFPESCWPYVIKKLEEFTQKPQVGLTPYVPPAKKPNLNDKLNRSVVLPFPLPPFQILTSYLIVAGLGCFSKDAPPIPQSVQAPLVNAVLPWLGSTHSFARVISQLVLHDLLPLVLTDYKPGVEEPKGLDQRFLW